MRPVATLGGGNEYITADLAVKTTSMAIWTTDAGSMVVQQVPSLKFMWSLQYMLRRIWESQDRAAGLAWMPSNMEDRKPDANRRDDDHKWTELSNLSTSDIMSANNNNNNNNNF